MYPQKYKKLVLFALSRDTVACIACFCFVCGFSVAEDAIQFDRDIRPILSANCFQCHGPDSNQRQADLRLDQKEGLLETRDDYFILVPRRPDQSELVRRITTRDPDQQMPPPDSKLKLTDAQIELLKVWIKQGANWSQHWSFVSPTRPSLPSVQEEQTPRNPIDHFVLAKLNPLNISPSPEATRETLVRRLALDLTGLPPPIDLVDSFLANDETFAYDQLVDQFLASPRFGERMAMNWLDAARYADTSGYQNDGPRHMWRWRDWVIKAFNANMPFDQFTIEQLAGDMLPNATLAQTIASGFNRNHRGNAEGGIIPEEYAVEYVVDRIDTTATVWLGLTVGCARCHDHKFDPITQEEFYQLFAYFNNVPESGRAIKEGNSPPWIPAPTPLQQRAWKRLQKELDQAESDYRALKNQIDHGFEMWTKKSTSDLVVHRDLIAQFRWDHNPQDSQNSNRKLDVQQADGQLEYTDGVAKNRRAAKFNGKISIAYSDAKDAIKNTHSVSFNYFDRFSFSAWVNAQRNEKSDRSGGTILSKMIDEPQATGYSVVWYNGHIQLNLVRRWLDDSIRVQTKAKIMPNEWHHIVVSYDGTRVAKGIKIYVDGIEQELQVNLDFINQSFETTEPFRIGAGGGPASRFIGLIDDVRVYRRCLDAGEAAILSVPETPTMIGALESGQRSENQKRKLRQTFLQYEADANIQAAYRQLGETQERLSEFERSLPNVMVMHEGPPRKSFVLERGQYDRPGKEVQPGVPTCLSNDLISPKDRMELAQWICDAKNPLTARVAVNRIWQMFFGVGLVRTAEDFGVQGERPSHPLLLDWLATELVESDWDVKQLVRLIVSSRTYRQSSAASSTSEQDPDNRLLARGTRMRLEAEMIRDQALAVSGLLDHRLGGASVKPYQPDGLWAEIASDKKYVQATGADLYRRSMYTYWKRTVAAPTMMAFDASTRETCTVRKSRTNTPLQALALMNDVTFVECARVLAEKSFAAEAHVPDRIRSLFRSVMSRNPNQFELRVLENGFHQHFQHYEEHLDDAKQLIGSGEYPLTVAKEKTAELAALTVISSLILNLDEAITKE